MEDMLVIKPMHADPATFTNAKKALKYIRKAIKEDYPNWSRMLNSEKIKAFDEIMDYYNRVDGHINERILLKLNEVGNIILDEPIAYDYCTYRL